MCGYRKVKVGKFITLPLVSEMVCSILLNSIRKLLLILIKHLLHQLHFTWPANDLNEYLGFSDTI